MDIISSSPVNQFLYDSLGLLLFSFISVEGIHHLRCCEWVWNKISNKTTSHCLRLLGISFQMGVGLIPVSMWLLAYRVPCGHGKCNIFIRRCQYLWRFCYENWKPSCPHNGIENGRSPPTADFLSENFIRTLHFVRRRQTNLG